MLQLMEGKTRDCAFELYTIDEKRIEAVLQAGSVDPDDVGNIFREAFQAIGRY